jgi:regulator of protease activity HflC (stomatin/prohibitin superfamily)
MQSGFTKWRGNLFNIDISMQASYDVQNPEYAISQLAQTVMRSEVGELMLDNVFHERANLNMTIVGKLKRRGERNVLH